VAVDGQFSSLRPVRFVRELLHWESEQRLTLAASGAAFWLCLAAFPAAVAAVNILGLVVDQREVARRVSDLALIGSTAVGRLLEQQLEQVAAPSPGTLVVDTFLVLLALWSVSRAMRYLIDAIRAAHGLPKRPVLAHYGVSMAAGLLAVLALGFIAYLVRFVAGGSVLFLDVVGFALAVVLVSALYAAALGRVAQFGKELPGIAVSTVGLVLVVVGVKVYSDVAGEMQAIYGTLGGVVLAMLAVWFLVYAVLVGAAVNAQREEGNLEP
jgi:membrane protein